MGRLLRYSVILKYFDGGEYAFTHESPNEALNMLERAQTDIEIQKIEIYKEERLSISDLKEEAREACGVSHMSVQQQGSQT